MKTKFTIMMALTAILVTVLIFPSIGSVDASTATTTEVSKITKTMKANTSDELKPKSYGEKTKNSICNDKLCFDDNLRSQHGKNLQKIKDMRKQIENDKAIEFMQTYYKIRV